jgi:hypothetical protein
MMGKSAENLGASPLKKSLPNDTTFSRTNLAGQSLRKETGAYWSQVRDNRDFSASGEDEKFNVWFYLAQRDLSCK